MATFKIHQDSEKENPLNVKSMNIKTNVLQPLMGAKSDKQAVRSNFGVISANNGQSTAALRPLVAGSKVAFRNTTNNGHTVQQKGKDENAGFPATNAAAKKSTVVPVVEQFKTFSVYEDIAEDQLKQQKQKLIAVSTITTTTTSSQSLEVDKENLCIVSQQQRVDIKSTSIHQDFGGLHDEDYVLDTTPMSVTDVLSPMSVDRSQLNNSELTDDSIKVADEPKAPTALPRNDRQRFFEVPEYQHSILEYFVESEKKHRPKPHYMRRQTDINYSMRTILVDWLVEVSEEYNLDTETLYLSVSYIDRFLSHMSVVRSKLQLVGTAAMYIASKYEEIYPPDVSEFVFITDDTYNKAQVLRMEQIILKILAFDLCTPTAHVFINTYAVLCSMPDKLKFLTQYICELSLLEADPYLRFHPSIISAASLALARYLLDYPIWTADLQEITTYSLFDLKEVLLCLVKSHNAAPTLTQQAIQEKYKADKYRQVSSIAPVEISEDLFNELVRKHMS